jgi:hypothetical protein
MSAVITRRTELKTARLHPVMRTGLRTRSFYGLSDFTESNGAVVLVLAKISQENRTSQAPYHQALSLSDNLATVHLETV